jgi:hypothetical protein
MQTRCYSICRRCAAIYPQGRRCPDCDGDLEAARSVAAATAHAVEAAKLSRRQTMGGGTLVVTGVVAVSLAAGLGMLALALV